MPFALKWDPELRTRTPDRTITGPAVAAPETGTTVQSDGTVIVANQTVQPSIPPATPVKVNLPNPNEPIIGRDGRINHHWWRFFNELYLRTGGVVDNINKNPETILGASSTTAALGLTGLVPTVSRFANPGADALVTSGEIPVMVPGP